MYSAVEASSYAFVASRVQSWVLQDHILRDSGISGMDSDFCIALNNLHVAIPDYDLDSFVNKGTAPPKPQHILASALFGKIIKEMEVKFNMRLDRRPFLGVYRHHMPKIFFLLFLLMGLDNI